MLSSGAPLPKTLLLAPQKVSPPARNFVGLTLKEYFNIDHGPLAHIDEENQSDAEADAATPSFPNARQTRDRPRRTRHKTELEELLREEKQSLPKHTHRMATLSLEDILPAEKSVVKLPSIHDQRQPKVQRNEARRVDESSSINLALFLRKSGKEGKGSVGKNGMVNVRRGMRSRVTSTSFYHMNVRDRTKTEEDGEVGLEKSFVITRYGALKGAGKASEDAALRKYENSFKLSKH